MQSVWEKKPMFQIPYVLNDTFWLINTYSRFERNAVCIHGRLTKLSGLLIFVDLHFLDLLY